LKTARGDLVLCDEEQTEGRGVQRLERRDGLRAKPKLLFPHPPDWIVLGPKGYRTMNRTCSMTNIARAEYPKNIFVSYQCEQYEPKRVWTEQVEMGFLSSDHLYITPRTSAPNR
jgi:hypothetical protein